MNESYLKPLPEPSIDSQPYWDGLKARRIMLQRCADCHTVRHYPRPMCGKCHSMEVDWIEASGKGEVYSWTIAHHPFHIGFKAETPYILATVDLEEGVRIQSQLLDIDPADMKIGLAVEVIFGQATDDLVLPYFRVAK